MYLPQFHRVKENDEWWGEGFTEWTAVKQAEKLYCNHRQPRKPLNDNYYNLLDVNTLKWQAELAEDYLIDGFCFYHYYFKDGRKILEKPAELLLQHPEIRMKFCFCWANEAWITSWSKLTGKGNCWTLLQEGDIQSKSEDGVLLAQEYGEEETWKEHFMYLLPFFNDIRYLRKDGKPIFVIYKPDDMDCFSDMIEYWQKLAMENGLKGLFIIARNLSGPLRGADATLFTGPGKYCDTWSMRCANYNDTGDVYDYYATWYNALKLAPTENVKTYFGAFVDYDDSPRRGKCGWRFEGVSLEIFKEMFLKLGLKNLRHGNDLMFINAWNEWGEGMYLEPDEENGYGYLEAIREDIQILNEANYIDSRDLYVMNEIDHHVNNIEENITFRMYKSYYHLLNNWMNLCEANNSICNYFIQNKYTRITIYGLGVIGQRLLNELSQCKDLEIVDVIDKKNQKYLGDRESKQLGDAIMPSDVIVVTPIYDYERIKADLLYYYGADFNIISLGQVFE